MLRGGCHCGAVRYEMPVPERHALCHCEDCRRCAGAPLVGWAIVSAQALHITGELRSYRSSEHGVRQFCPACGTGLFYLNDQVFPGLVDVQTCTLDDPDAAPPQVNIQVAERIGWMKTAHDLPSFDRYPG